MKYTYTNLGIARIALGDGSTSVPIDGNYIYGVRTAPPRWSNTAPIVLGLVQQHSTLGTWRAVPALGETYPQVDFTTGLWSMTPGRSDFSTRREACAWLLAIDDTRSAWFAEATRTNS